MRYRSSGLNILIVSGLRSGSEMSSAVVFRQQTPVPARPSRSKPNAFPAPSPFFLRRSRPPCFVVCLLFDYSVCEVARYRLSLLCNVGHALMGSDEDRNGRTWRYSYAEKEINDELKTGLKKRGRTGYVEKADSLLSPGSYRWVPC